LSVTGITYPHAAHPFVGMIDCHRESKHLHAQESDHHLEAARMRWSVHFDAKEFAAFSASFVQLGPIGKRQPHAAPIISQCQASIPAEELLLAIYFQIVVSSCQNARLVHRSNIVITALLHPLLPPSDNSGFPCDVVRSLSCHSAGVRAARVPACVQGQSCVCKGRHRSE
jgi:hypothetical protein